MHQTIDLLKIKDKSFCIIEHLSASLACNANIKRFQKYILDRSY